MSLRPCLTPSSMQYSDIYIHTPHPHPHPHPHTPTHTHPHTPTPTPHPHPHTPHPHTTPTPTPHHTHTPHTTLSNLSLNLPSHYPTSPLVTLPHSTIPLPTTIHLSTYYYHPPPIITVTLQLPISNSTTITLLLPYHPPCPTHCTVVLPSILKR
uniref:Putative uncharacterized protein YHR217C n=1 Tax=Saccharomyces cerevisiae (strain ATCC 204508 / S288c) TaxID=559292 RepID=YH17_YEAST|nr:RecName: Full=Putative uncharacterized protein YHR217C [Saccharomyces cerevisiae S288C]AAB69740.1 Yhr217cp [Saccharomyces cerevisiae]